MCYIIFVCAILIVGMCIYAINTFIRSIPVNNLHGKHIVITGCDSGFGLELALRLDGMGFYVYAGCLTKPGRDSLSNKASSRLKVLQLDVTDRASIQAMYDSVSHDLPAEGLWALVNNAGVGGVECPVEMCTVQDFHNTIKVSKFPPFYMPVSHIHKY